jgi:glycosyltransferase involved in cell wall biosynthesis
VRALPSLLERHPDVTVLVVGGVYDDRFLELADTLGVRGSMLVTGAVPHVEVADYLAAATVDCHDLDGHTLGITTLEAMAAGVPVFAIVRRDVFPGVDFGDWRLPHVVEAAEPSDIADALSKLLDSPSLRCDTAAEQRRFVAAHFRADEIARRYLQLFAERAHESPKRRQLG